MFFRSTLIAHKTAREPYFIGLVVHKEIVFQERRYQEKPIFQGVTEVVECCQMCWNLHRMQHICSRYATKILICIGHFSVEILGNVLFACHEQDCFAICEWHRLFSKSY